MWKALGGQIIYNHCPQQSWAIVCSIKTIRNTASANFVDIIGVNLRQAYNLEVFITELARRQLRGVTSTTPPYPDSLRLYWPSGAQITTVTPFPTREVMKYLMIVNTTSLNGQLHVNVRNKCQCQHHQRGSDPTLHIGQDAGVTWSLNGIPKTEHCKARDCLNLLAPICCPPHGTQQF